MFPGVVCADPGKDFQCDTQAWLLPFTESFSIAGAGITESKAGIWQEQGRQHRAGELGERWELLLLPAASADRLQLGSSHSASTEKVKTILLGLT